MAWPVNKCDNNDSGLTDSALMKWSELKANENEQFEMKNNKLKL